MKDAEQAVRKAAAEIPAEVSERLDIADELSDADRETIIRIARQALEAFSPEAEPEQEPQKQHKRETKPQTKRDKRKGSSGEPS
jgi:F-type H+-transporting ATPase subunit alpha